MTARSNIRVHELTFCGMVKSWADALFAAHPEWPFTHASIEEYTGGSRKRHDLRIYIRGRQTPVLCGEVKMPGTPEGRTPFSPDLMQDAFTKADQIQAPYFFTWNVNHFVLFDRGRWNRPMIERRIYDWNLGLDLTNPGDCARPEVQAMIREQFLPEFFGMLAAIVAGEVEDWGRKPDDIFISSLESHLAWPILGTRDYLAARAAQEPAFSLALQAWMAEEMEWTFDPDRADSWRAALENAARTLCYVFCNRAIFYEALRVRYEAELPPLDMPDRGALSDPNRLYGYFRRRFEQAMTVSGDYEPVFYPQVRDDWGALVFADERACEGWQGLFRNLAEYNFRKIPYDVIGGIFQKLIAPEERQKFGQYFTNEDIVDVINAFCIRRAGDRVLDPACGSGSFLVRAYHRKAWLSQQRSGGRRHLDREKSHEELLREIFGCDIALFAAHLATLNLAARDIKEDENYPLIARRNFFEVPEDRKAFCHIPGLRNEAGRREQTPVPLPELDAIIGNPPYVRQERIAKRGQIKRGKDETEAAYRTRLQNTKEYMQELCRRLWPDIKPSGRSDLHCYFWPVAAAFLREGGRFGFLTSSAWLDVEYGFPLQGWILRNFKILAIIESVDEPWFRDARIKTAATLLERCSDPGAREKNVVRFVRLQKPVARILGDRPAGDETARQRAVEGLRRRILTAKKKVLNESYRIIPIPQIELWREGVKAHRLLTKNGGQAAERNESGKEMLTREARAMYDLQAVYGGGKWGRFLRAPDVYFSLMERFRDRFVRLGEIAEVRRGITSGCDAFFMPRDVTRKILEKVAAGLRWNDVGLMAPCRRREVESGRVRIVQAGDTTLHPIETEFLRPEVHSLMQVDRPVIRAADTDRVVLWVDRDVSELAGTYAAKYIRWGAHQTFASKKSKAVAVPERSTCAARKRWYDLTNMGIGDVFWPMAQQYRHIIPANPEELLCNHNLFFLTAREPVLRANGVLCAVLNSTLVALFKHFYGRYAGTEGNLKTEVVDTVLLEVPDPRGVSPELADKLRKALESMCRRKVTHLVGESLLKCHSVNAMRELLEHPLEMPRELEQPDRRALDDAVLEMIGATDPDEREALLDELYRGTAFYYRFQRTLEIQGARNRQASNGNGTSPRHIAESIWSLLDKAERGAGWIAWVRGEYRPLAEIDIPEGRPRLLGADDMFHPNTIVFQDARTSVQMDFAHPEQAALVAWLAGVGIRGPVALPKDAATCAACLAELRERQARMRERFAELARTRTGNDALQRKVTDLLLHWYMHGH